MGQPIYVTGPTYEGKTIKALNRSVLVPTSMWKAMHVPVQGTAAWIVTNTANSRCQVVSIAELARRTGIDPFPWLAVAAKAKVPAFPSFRRDRAKRDR